MTQRNTRMEFSGAKFLNSLKLVVLLVCVSCVTVTSGQDVKSWTFNIPGVSFISFSPDFTNTQNQRIILNFRTRNPNGLIFCHYLKDLDVDELERINYKFCGELQYGVFVLNYQLMQYSESGLSVGKALHNNQWHSLDVFINVTSGELTVKVDEDVTVTSLKAYTRQSFTSLLDWSTHRSAIYFGGTDPNTLFSEIYPHFHGCMSDLRYQSSDGRMVSVPVSMLEGVVKGCLDMCTSDPCHHGGQCINNYSDAVCDCFSTDYQGKICSELGPTSITLRGYEWITYAAHPYDETILTDTMRLSMEFKTSRGSGVLFYAVGGAPYHSHVTASVHAGKVHVSMAFWDEDLDITAGIGIDDYRWHNLTIVHSVQKMYVYLDGREHVRDILNGVHHLALDPKVYIGGGKDFIVTRGLQVTQNFVGCLKNVYINDHSVLYDMSNHRPQAQYHGGANTLPYYGCKEVVNIPISFPSSASMLKFDSTEIMRTDFTVEFDFKTVRSEAILIYASLQSVDPYNYQFGYVEVWIRNGKPQLQYVPSTLRSVHNRNYSIPISVNTNVWRSLQLSIKNGTAKLMVNGNSVSTVPIPDHMEIPLNSKVVIGYGLNVYKESEGYVGCIRNLKVLDRLLDAIDVVQNASGLIIDGCNITDYCAGNRMCEHGGVCLSEWTGVACDCTETHYTGHACHFPKYQKTCDEYFQSGVDKSGVRMVDLDGPGPLDPVYANCEMGYELNFEFFGKTVVHHNLEPNTTVRRALMRDLKKNIEYREFERTNLILLTTESAWCQQYIRYDCQHSPLRLGMDTWFKAANGEMVEYLGTNERQPGHCTCSLQGSCDRCYCDNQTMLVQYDEGYNEVRKQLPITQITVKQDADPLNPGSGNFTLGPLVCWGNKNQMPRNAVTFSSDEGYLLSQAWKSGSIRVSFRTHHSSAIILYQTGTSDNINLFLVAVMSDTSVKFYFRWGLKKLEVDITSPKPVSDGKWHQVRIETDRYNLRCMLDMNEKMLRVPDDVPTITMFSGILYIGGVPSSVKREAVVGDIKGMVGCMRGLAYNQRIYSLSDLIDPSTPGSVHKECMASCWPNPCKNGATCLEKWGEHQCVCLNPWAHSGHNCELDINTDMVTFLGRDDSYMHFTKLVETNLLDESVVFNFRTFQLNTLLFYMHDHLNNFIQVELVNGNKILTKFNRFNMIFEQSREVTDFVNDGRWNQVVVNNTDSYIKVIVNVDDEPTRNSYKRLGLDSYSQNPFSQAEIVKPYRPEEMPKALIHIYVGGAPKYMTSHPTLDGCMRGLKVGDIVFQLQDSASLNPAVSDQCRDGCEESPCKHGGVCLERWQDAQYVCDCSASEYAGPTCDTESSGMFSGSSILQYRYDPPKAALETWTVQLELIFQVDPGVKENMLLIFIYSDRPSEQNKDKKVYVTHDFILVYLDPDHGIYMSINPGYNIHGIGKEGLFADGRPHKLLYQRKQSEMILTVRDENHALYSSSEINLDEEGIGRVTVPDNALDEIDTIMIGGILQSQIKKMPDTSSYGDYLNFTGCMSEVKFFPTGKSDFALRPLKDLRDGVNTTGFVTIYGPEIPGCNTRDQMAKVETTTVPTVYTTPDLLALTLPPWSPGPAETVFIGPERVVPSNVTSTSPLVTSVTTARPFVVTDEDVALETHERDKHGMKVLIIALCVVGFLLLTAIIVACILVRIRRRERRLEKQVAEKQQEIELKRSLANDEIDPAEGAMISENLQNQNYLARLDEFSMVSATLGARPPPNGGTSTFKPPSTDSASSYSSIPQSDGTLPEVRYFNRKKNRPASSISEVLEVIERQRLLNDGTVEDGCSPDSRQEVPETTPLSCGNDGAYMTAIPEHHDDDEENDADNESGSLSPPPPTHLSHEYNGDSGYEAESKPDEEEEHLMIDSFHGNPTYKRETTPTKGLADIADIDRRKLPPMTLSTDSAMTHSTGSNGKNNTESDIENIMPPVTHSPQLSRMTGEVEGTTPDTAPTHVIEKLTPPHSPLLTSVVIEGPTT